KSLRCHVPVELRSGHAPFSIELSQRHAHQLHSGPQSHKHIHLVHSLASLTGILITYTCILTHLHRVYSHRVHNHPHLSQPLHIPHSPFTRCLVSHFNGYTTSDFP